MVSSATHGDEEILIPVAVGRKLKHLKDEDSLSVGSRAELLFQVREVSAHCIRLRVEDLLNRRDYSSSELSQKLRDDGYFASVVDSYISRLQEIGLLDDRRFADVFVRSKLSCGWGRAKIERELSRRGIAVSDLSGWPDDYFTDEDELGRAFDLASRRRLTGKNDFQKLVRFLCSRGFSMGISMDAARRVLSEDGSD